MPEYLQDPSVLTKDKLKSELLSNNVVLPTGDQRKDVYVQLYLNKLTVQNDKLSSTDPVFSSDDDFPLPLVLNKSRSGRKATRKTDKPEDLDVTGLTSEGLKDELFKYGVNAGPIVASTRKLYERRLQKLLDHGPPETVALPVAVTQVDSNHNGNSDSYHYSDKEEEMTTVPEPVPVVERPVRSRGKTPVTTRTRSSQHNRIYAPEEEEDDDLEEEHPVLNIKRPSRRSSHRVDQMVPASDVSVIYTEPVHLTSLSPECECCCSLGPQSQTQSRPPATVSLRATEIQRDPTPWQTSRKKALTP